MPEITIVLLMAILSRCWFICIDNVNFSWHPKQLNKDWSRLQLQPKHVFIRNLALEYHSQMSSGGVLPLKTLVVCHRSSRSHPTDSESVLTGREWLSSSQVLKMGAAFCLCRSHKLTFSWFNWHQLSASGGWLVAWLVGWLGESESLKECCVAASKPLHGHLLSHFLLNCSRLIRVLILVSYQIMRFGMVNSWGLG